MIIALEGVDGCGKTSVGEHLANVIGAKLVHFPDDAAETGPAIRGYLKRWWQITNHMDEIDKELGGFVFQALQLVNRVEHLDELRACAGNSHRHMVLSRYWQSGMVYGELDGVPSSFLAVLRNTVPPADLNIYLRVSAEVSVKRVATRGARPELYEADLNKARDLVHGFDVLWNKHGGPNWCSANAEFPLDDVKETAEDVVSDFFGRHMS